MYFDKDIKIINGIIGMMWHADRSLHYYLDGMDMGKAWYVPHLNIYAVVDLYGQCTQVTIYIQCGRLRPVLMSCGIQKAVIYMYSTY